jgi:hypothetical protein
VRQTRHEFLKNPKLRYRPWASTIYSFASDLRAELQYQLTEAEQPNPINLSIISIHGEYEFYSVDVEEIKIAKSGRAALFDWRFPIQFVPASSQESLTDVSVSQ